MHISNLQLPEYAEFPVIPRSAMLEMLLAVDYLKNTSYDEQTKVILAFVEENNVHYYAKPKELFNEDEAYQEARKLGKRAVIVDVVS